MSLLKSKLAISILATAAGSLYGIPASAVVVGLDPTGQGNYSIFADIWDDFANELGTSEGMIAPGATQTFTTQVRVVGFVDTTGGIIPTPSELNNPNVAGGFEITKVSSFQNILTNLFFGMDGSATVQLDAIAPGQVGGAPELEIYLDDISDGGSTQASAGNGAGNVSCFGAGSTSVGCTDATDNDGTLILSGQIASINAVFTANPNTGINQGSFLVGFDVDFVDSNYLDIDQDKVSDGLVDLNVTGQFLLPSNITPDEMWDGTPTSGPNTLLFQVDASETFFVPEPATVILLGSSLLGLSFSRNMRKKRAA